MRHLLRSLGLGLAMLAITASADDSSPRFFSAPPGALAKAKERLNAGDAAVKPAFDALIASADKDLRMAPQSVMDKPQNPPSGDKHDYMSQAPYFWPDPTKKDGLPYIRKDGERNPESHDAHSDAPRMSRMANAAESLALAAYFTGKDDYAEHAAKLLRTWFLDPATRMNPNFNFAQAVPGVNTGRGTGMIESRSIIPAMNAAELLAGTKNWSASDNQGLRTWMNAFLEWAQTSENGKAEGSARNNHGSFYDEQLAVLALYLGKGDLAKEILEGVKTKRIVVQFKPDGSQPLELARADSFGYSRFNVMAHCNLAILGQWAGVDLWHYEAPNGASLRKAIDFLLPYVEQPEKEWPYEHDHKAARNLTAQLWQAGIAYGDQRYLAAARKAPDFPKSLEALLFLAPP